MDNNVSKGPASRSRLSSEEYAIIFESALEAIKTDDDKENLRRFWTKCAETVTKHTGIHRDRRTIIVPFYTALELLSLYQPGESLVLTGEQVAEIAEQARKGYGANWNRVQDIAGHFQIWLDSRDEESGATKGPQSFRPGTPAGVPDELFQAALGPLKRQLDDAVVQSAAPVLFRLRELCGRENQLSPQEWIALYSAGYLCLAGPKKYQALTALSDTKQAIVDCVLAASQDPSMLPDKPLEIAGVRVNLLAILLHLALLDVADYIDPELLQSPLYGEKERLSYWLQSCITEVFVNQGHVQVSIEVPDEDYRNAVNKLWVGRMVFSYRKLLDVLRTASLPVFMGVTTRVPSSTRTIQLADGDLLSQIQQAAAEVYDQLLLEHPEVLLGPSRADIERSFIKAGRPLLDLNIRDDIAQIIHCNYRAERAGSLHRNDPSMAGWAGLPDDLKESNRRQADSIYEKLQRVDCRISKVNARGGYPKIFTPEEIEAMAELEHHRWMVERLLAGWTLGEKRDPELKTSPYLVAWSQLSKDIKELDRQAVRQIPAILAQVGLEVRQEG